jgi:HEAT repeat protein
VPAEAKLPAKSFIDTVVWRAGDGLAGLTVLALATFGGIGPVPITLVNIPLLVVWLVLAARVHRRYVSTLEETLQQHRIDAEKADTPVVDRETEEVLAARLRADDPGEILYALDLMALGRSAAAHPAVRGLLDHGHAEVRARALRILGEAGERSVLAQAEALLRDPAMEVRTEALLFLARHSDTDPVTRVQDLGDYPDSSVRAALVAVLARLGGPAAAGVLAEHLLDGDAALRLRILGALDRLRESSGVAVDPRPLEAALGAEILGHYRSYQILGTVNGADPEQVPIVTGLRAAMREELERVFRLLDLLHPQRDFRSAWVALQSGDRVIHDQALDLLDSLLQPGLRHLLVPLVDPAVDESQRTALAQRLVGVPLDGPEAAVAALVGTGDPWLRSCAAYAIGALGLRSMEAQLDSWADDPDPLLRETVRQARARLEAGVRS